MSWPTRDHEDRRADVGRYATPVDAGLAESARFPLLTDDGRRLLRRLREHPAAPAFNFEPGDRLTSDGLRQARELEVELQAETAFAGCAPDSPPPWVLDFLARAHRDVPYYRARGAAPRAWADVPTMDKAALEAQPWAFVPDTQPLDELVVYATSGSGGAPVPVLSHPAVPTLYLPLLRWALARQGVRLEGGPGNVAIVQVAYQRYTFTYATISTYLGQAGSVKVNLRPEGWKHPDDRVRFLDDCRPEVIAGDPIAFAALLHLPVTCRPKALVTTSMAMPRGLRAALVDRFGCPLVDLYSLTECGPIAADGGDGWEIFPRRLHVEALDPAGRPLAFGERGELSVTGGFNPFLPLLRYRTGDVGAVELRGGRPVLTRLELRPPVVFRATDGRVINNIDVSQALEPLALPRFSVHQAAAGRLLLSLGPDLRPARRAEAALRTLFGDDQRIDVAALPPHRPGERFVPYTSELPFRWDGEGFV